MPKPRQRVASGLSVSDLLKMPISKLENYDLKGMREITSRLASAGNKRLKNLQNAGIENSAVLRVEQGGGKFSVRNKQKDDVIKEFIRARDFLKSRISTVSGWKKVIKNIKEKSEFKGLDEIDVSKAYAMYDYLREIEPELVNKVHKYSLVGYIMNVYDEGKSKEEVFNKSMKWMNEKYQQQKSEYESKSTRFNSNIEDDIPKRLKTKRRKKRK